MDIVGNGRNIAIIRRKDVRRERQSGFRILIIINSTGSEINVKLRMRPVSDGGGDESGLKLR